MCRAHRICLFTVLVCVGLPGFAQQPWSIGASAHYGFLWPHRPSSWILVDGHAGAFELSMERAVNGDRPWHRTYGMPRYGLLAVYTRMANPENIGDAAALIPYITMPFVHGGRCSFGLRIGWGVGYIAKPFDRRENTQQIAIGSRINNAIQLMPEFRYQVDRLSFSGGIAIDHWSNGSLKQPNLGLNFLSLSFGTSYALATLPEPMAIDTTAYERPRREFAVIGSMGYSESGRPYNGQYNVVSISGGVSWRCGGKGALSGGFDVFNKGDLGTVHEELVGGSRLSYSQYGVHGGGSLLLGRAELLFNCGVYVYTPVVDDAPIYQRLGGRYRFGRHLIAGVTLKTHYATADHMEFGIGYRWD